MQLTRRKLVAGLGLVALICLVVCCLFTIYTYLTVYQEEKRFFEENHKKFDEVIAYSERRPDKFQYCSEFESPSEIGTWISSIYACYDSNLQLDFVWIMPIKTNHSYCYIRGLEKPQSGLHIGNSPYGVQALYGLGDFWFICILRNG